MLAEGVAALEKVVGRLTAERDTANDKIMKLVEIASHREAMTEEKEGEIQALKIKIRASSSTKRAGKSIAIYVKKEERKQVRECEKWMETRKMELRKEFEMGLSDDRPWVPPKDLNFDHFKGFFFAKV
ncbi:hypothetical protein K440DRAFT_628803 [Wilcoxina mikolae CBS 423.85]|nr:hypothetical protein K440DRAFT_628803 [Wilcoxina mikolae CBS 423.85]